MTVIIGTLNLPYSVQFEVPEHYRSDSFGEPSGINVSPKQPERSTSSIAIPSSSILSGMKLGSTSTTPLSQSPHIIASKVAENDLKTAEEFFYNHYIKKSSSESIAPQSSGPIPDKGTAHYIQPKSRISNLNLQSTIVEPKKNLDDEWGLPSLKINRSVTNLAALSAGASKSNLACRGNILKNRTATTFAKPVPGFTLHGNQSTASLDESTIDHSPYNSSTDVSQYTLSDPYKHGWEIDDFNEMSDPRAPKLAPFGGFSNPDIEEQLLNHDSIFETAPWEIIPSEKGNVSLTKAVKVAGQKGEISNRKWVGTLAMPIDAIPKTVTDDIATELSECYNSEAVFPSDTVYQGHYKSFCKQILWPTLHYQIPDDPKSKAFEDHSWSYYKQLNQMVANKIIEVYKRENGDADPNDPENLIWIHDYHLLLVPQMIREKLPNAKIGLFLHVSFPSSEVFKCLAQRIDILNGMLGANCVSFQTQEYVRHFLQTCNRLLLVDTSDTGLTHNNSFIITNTIPVGIDEESLTPLVESEEVSEFRELIRDRFRNNKIILSRDKLNKLRGIKQKMLAYEKFLKNSPENVENTVLIQICSGTSDDPEFESEIMQIVSRINSLPENISDTPPVVLLKRDIEFEQYLALQSEADIFIVSSQREGMNLTCHEFITSTQEKKSPLVLSEFTGSAPYLECNGKGAILINPWDIKEFSKLIDYLFHMSEEEKRVRWENQFKVVQTLDSKSWVRDCLKSINESWERDQRRNTCNLKPFTQQVFEEAYRNGSGKKLVFLNLESPSAVVDLNDRNTSLSDKSLLSEPTRYINHITELLRDSRNHVYLITFLKRSDLDILYKRFPNIGLIAENGGYIKLVGSKRWLSIVDENEIKSWMPQLIQLIQSKVERLPGSYCEVGDCTVRFHPGSALTENKVRAMDAMGDCIQHINEVFLKSDGVHCALVKNVVVVQKDQLALKALKFLITTYTQGKSRIETELLIKEYNITKIPHRSSKSKSSSTAIPTASSSTKIGEILSAAGNNQNQLSFILFCGGTSPLDEPSYEYLNHLKETNEIDNILTVAILSLKFEGRTSATYSVNTKQEFLTLLSKSNYANVN
jgi:trehalose 6-phosphate synthase/phosphatase